ncbi:MAG TPA: hypothetical protein VMW62_08055 [Chloroflexota bacterium]|nr:hypothetical protein [Chloroflexota bacterium]
MSTNKNWILAAGVALWLPLLFSFLGALRVPRLPGMAVSQLLMVALLVAATLLLGMLIGRAACATEPSH